MTITRPSRRRLALESLAAALQCAVPGLAVCPWPTPPNHQLEFPSVAIVPVRWPYFPDQATEVYDLGPGGVVMDVGRDEPLIQLRLVGATPVDRMDVESALLDLFLGTPLRPGVLLTSVGEGASPLGPFLCAWQLDEEEWDDAKAFDKEFWSIISLTGEVPARVVRRAPRIRNLQLGISPSNVPWTDPRNTRVRVNKDGTYTKLP